MCVCVLKLTPYNSFVCVCRLDDVDASVAQNIAVVFQIDVDYAPGKPLQHCRQQRDAVCVLVCSGGRAVREHIAGHRAGRGEWWRGRQAGQTARQVGEVGIVHSQRLAGGSMKRGVVHHHHLAVLGEPHVQLQQRAAARRGVLEGGDCVLNALPAAPAMGAVANTESHLAPPPVQREEKGREVQQQRTHSSVRHHAPQPQRRGRQQRHGKGGQQPDSGRRERRWWVRQWQSAGCGRVRQSQRGLSAERCGADSGRLQKTFSAAEGGWLSHTTAGGAKADCAGETAANDQAHQSSTDEAIVAATHVIAAALANTTGGTGTMIAGISRCSTDQQQTGGVRGCSG